MKGIRQMEETISTISEPVQEQTTPEIQEEQQTSESPVKEVQEPEIVEENGTETEPQETETKPIDYEKIAKDHQAAFTKSQQEISDLKKELEQLKAPKEPSIVDETGNISKDFKEKHQLQIDNNEFLTYEGLTRNIADLETRASVENLLREAQNAYQFDKSQYEQIMDEVKTYFNPRIIEQIAKEKIQAEQGLDQKFKSELEKNKTEQAKALANQIEAEPELFTLVDAKSEDYSPEVFGIVKQLFDKYGSLDVEMTKNAISKIKALGVKEYQAQQKLEATKETATVPTGAKVNVVSDNLPTAQEITENPANYKKFVDKYGEAKIDEIIMKG